MIRPRRHAHWVGLTDQGPLTSASREEIEPSIGGKQSSRALAHSRLSFSFNARRSSSTEKLGVVSKDMVAVAARECG